MHLDWVRYCSELCNTLIHYTYNRFDLKIQIISNIIKCFLKGEDVEGTCAYPPSPPATGGVPAL